MSAVQIYICIFPSLFQLRSNLLPSYYTLFLYKNVIFLGWGSKLLKNPDFSLKKFLFLTFSQAQNFLNFSDFPKHISTSKFFLTLYTYILKIYVSGAPDIPLSLKNKYFEVTKIFFNMGKIQAQILLNWSYLFNSFCPSLTSFLISFLILVWSQPDPLIKHILIKKSVFLYLWNLK